MPFLPFSLLAAGLAVAAAVPAAPAAEPADPVVRLQQARRLGSDGDASGLDSIGKSSPLWAARVALVRAASGDRAAPPAGESLRLAGVDTWLSLRNDPATPAEALLRFAASAPSAPLAVAAIGEGSLRARTPPERRLVHDAAARLLASAPAGARTRTVLLLARFRSEGTDPERRAAMAVLATTVPDAPERDPSLFQGEEARLFRAAALSSSLEARIVRARALLTTRPDESAELLRRTEGATAEERFVVAVLLLATGRARESARLVAPLERAEPPLQADSARALSLAATLQLGAGGERIVKSRSGRRGASAGRAQHAAPAAAAGPADLDRLARTAEGLLAGQLLPEARHRLLLELLRSGRRADRIDLIRAAARGLVEIDPTGSAGGEELFQAAFAAYQSSDPEVSATSAVAFQEIAALYRNVSVRRRAVYWQARALQRRGDPAARALFASLLPGTSPDLYGRWSSDALGLEPSSPAPIPPAEPPSAGEAPAAPSREYLAAGLAGLAELAAEAEGSLDRPFSARIASERGDHRRAVSLLKGLHPALGTPEEGGVPLDERRLFYPLSHLRVLLEEAGRAGVPSSLLCGLIRQESLFQDRIVSRAGAVGLMQVMPATGRGLRRQEGGRGRPNLTLPDENVRLGTLFFGNLMRSFDGDVTAALAAYNAGPGRAARWKRERSALPPDEWVETIPIAETRDYVKRVIFFSGAYAALYGLPAPPGPARLSSAGGAEVRPAAAPAGPSRPSGGR